MLTLEDLGDGEGVLNAFLLQLGQVVEELSVWGAHCSVWDGWVRA